MPKKNLVPITLGLENYLKDPQKYSGNARVGLVCNQATVDHQFNHAADLLFRNDSVNLTTLFGPQHGIRGDVQDNMVETAHQKDKKTGIPIYSLYSETREPTEEMVHNLDVLVLDLQDVGCRVYTFIYTMANCMIACKKFDKKMIVLDRPNPINGIDIEGNTLEPGNESFVGMFPIPMRHGMTIGELARLFNRKFGIGCDLEIIKLEGWQRELYADETDLPWIMPSPNMPTVDTAVVFPGTVYFEGTQISEGRGTTRPFEIIGADFVDSDQFAQSLNDLRLPGVKFRAIEFMPTFQKHAQQSCGGVFVHVTDRRAFKPVATGVALVKTAYDLYSDNFKWKETAYEYAFGRNPFDVIDGSTKLRSQIEKGAELESIINDWDSGVNDFDNVRQSYLLY